MEDLSVRELQAYGAACLARYCAAKGIHSKHVEWLVDHLLLALVSTRLPVWETAGTMFELTGRGDPLPADLVELVRHTSWRDSSGLSRLWWGSEWSTCMGAIPVSL